MAYFINRNPCGRIICLHSLVKYLYNKFGGESFTLTDMKYDADSEYNIHQTCPLLTKLPSVPFPVCPYLDNPLSNAKCYLTQSVQRDKQKSKSVSDTFNALEGLDFVERTDKGGKLTHNGKNFALVDYHYKKCFHIIKKGLLSYGPFIGLLNEFVNSGGVIKKSEIKLGYPVTQETVKHKGRLVRLSTGSQLDTITRTRSVLFIWSVTGGFSIPVDISEPENKENWHVHTLPYVKRKKWTRNKFKILIKKDFFKTKKVVNNPLSYFAMTKTTRALRERNQEVVRRLSLEYENIVKNRRFAIVYLLAKCSGQNKKLDFDKTVQELRNFSNLFVIDPKQFDVVLHTELDIAPVSGMPYKSENRVLVPLTKLNMNKLCEGAPNSLVQTLDEIFEKVKQ